MHLVPFISTGGSNDLNIMTRIPSWCGGKPETSIELRNSVGYWRASVSSTTEYIAAYVNSLPGRELIKLRLMFFKVSFKDAKIALLLSYSSISF